MLLNQQAFLQQEILLNQENTALSKPSVKLSYSLVERPTTALAQPRRDHNT